MKKTIILAALLAMALGARPVYAEYSELMRLAVDPETGQRFQAGARVTVVPEGRPQGAANGPGKPGGEVAFVLRGDAVFALPPVLEYEDGTRLEARVFRVSDGTAYVFRPQGAGPAYRMWADYRVVRGDKGALFKFLSGAAEMKSEQYSPAHTQLAEPGPPAGPAEADLTFTDLEGHWAKEMVRHAVGKKIMEGLSNSRFAPDGRLTRAQTAQILYNLCGSGQGARAAAYADVDPAAWYADAVNWTQARGLIPAYQRDGAGALALEEGQPVESEFFRPNDEISREDTVTAIARLARVLGLALPGLNGAVRFTDQGKISPYAAEAVTTVQQSGVIAGREVLAPGASGVTWLDVAQWDAPGADDRFSIAFDPQGSLSRGEAAKIFDLFDEIYRALGA